MNSASNRREQLSAFLRAQRAKVKPDQVGIDVAGMRRTPGLRREEVAHLCHISLSWYTWLEQGKEISVSARLLERLARVLRLSAAERDLLFLLCNVRPPIRQQIHGETIVSEGLKQMVEGVEGPAFIKNSWWDLLYWNKAAMALFGDLSAVDPDKRNVIRLLFLDPEHMRLLVNWQQDARSAIAKFRLDASASKEDPVFRELISDLVAGSKAFARWWEESDVKGRDEEVKEFDHPVAGRLSFWYSLFSVDSEPGLRLNVYTPFDSESRKRMQRLKKITEQKIRGYRVCP
ncbi:helix-turn-helix transcriptional regulator [Cupriavidus basilensis]|uniref:Helix-turn-helix transcriptional regulator n=1 Tax=Cupriavidus basilensis TaxID=68895 RepID=A0ABT6AYH1_9BURK|nr:helix-turn-helix transcriptional regulator [Cupriavidus basilensis]MDF3837665.1 helix-turn-helix transcriptional regulator [Cupriavidus basilensis]